MSKKKKFSTSLMIATLIITISLIVAVNYELSRNVKKCPFPGEVNTKNYKEYEKNGFLKKCKKRTNKEIREKLIKYGWQPS